MNPSYESARPLLGGTSSTASSASPPAEGWGIEELHDRVAPAKSVRLFSVNYWPEPTGIGPYVTEFAEHLAAQGHDVEVITAHPHYPSWTPHADYDGRGTIIEEINGVRLCRVPVTLPSEMSLKGRARFELSYLRNAHRVTRQLKPVDVTIGYSPGLASGLMAMVSGRRHNGHHLVVQDLAGKGIEQSSLTSMRTVVKLVRSIESLAARKANKVIAISEAFVEALVDEGVARQNISVLGNWQKRDTQEPDPAKTGEFRRLFAPAGETVLMHTGSVGAKQGLEQILECAAATTDPFIKFVLVGDGGERRRLEELAKPLKNVLFLDPVAESDFASVLAAADVLILSQSRSNVDMSFPSKLSSYFGAARPVLACVPPTGSVARYLHANKAGLVVDGTATCNVLTAIESLQSEPELRERLVQAANAAQADWQADALLARWADELVAPDRSADDQAAELASASKN